MRVFTQRIMREAPPRGPNNWDVESKGAWQKWDDFWHVIDALGISAPRTPSPLNYTIMVQVLVNTEIVTWYIAGHYCGDESCMADAAKFVEIKNDYGFEVAAMVMSCNDDQHPTQMPIADVVSASFFNSTPVVTGYYLASDPDTLVSVP